MPDLYSGNLEFTKINEPNIPGSNCSRRAGRRCYAGGWNLPACPATESERLPREGARSCCKVTCCLARLLHVNLTCAEIRPSRWPGVFTTSPRSAHVATAAGRSLGVPQRMRVKRTRMANRAGRSPGVPQRQHASWLSREDRSLTAPGGDPP